MWNIWNRRDVYGVCYIKEDDTFRENKCTPVHINILKTSCVLTLDAFLKIVLFEILLGHTWLSSCEISFDRNSLRKTETLSFTMWYF